MKFWRAVHLWAPVVFWCGAIFSISAVPDVPGPPSELPELMFRKLAHLIEYGVLAVLVGRALKGLNWGARRVFWAGLVFCALYAASDEVHQSFVPGRFGKVRDVALDTLGAALALSLFARWMNGPAKKSDGFHTARVIPRGGERAKAEGGP